MRLKSLLLCIHLTSAFMMKRSTRPGALAISGKRSKTTDMTDDSHLPASKRQYFLMKNEPESYSVHDLAAEPDLQCEWEGVRNYVARNTIRSMRVGDEAFFYHSNAKKVGLPSAVCSMF